MTVQARVLDAALALCRNRGGWVFRPVEIVAALPDLNAASVRTHVMSRCCVNAPANHAHRWPYFRRLRRGVYQILPTLRERRTQASPGAGRDQLGARPEPPDPLVAAYAKDIDRTLIRDKLRRSVEERLDGLQHWMEAMDEIRGAAGGSGQDTGTA
jgi:hypothetical protein